MVETSDDASWHHDPSTGSKVKLKPRRPDKPHTQNPEPLTKGYTPVAQTFEPPLKKASKPSTHNIGA